MNIKRVAVELSGKDMLSIVKDFVDVKGLNIENIVINNEVCIEGFYKKVFNISFKVTVALVAIKDNVALLTVESISFGNIGIFKWIKNTALRMLSKVLKELGIEYIDGTICIYINKILKDIPFGIRFSIAHANIQDKLLCLNIEDIYFSLKTKELSTGNAVAIIRDEVEVKNEKRQEVIIEKVEDGYAKVREKVENKLPDKYTELLEYLMIMPDVVALLYRLFKDKRVPLKIKAVVGGIITYLISPIDILPDFIPFVGKIDDLALAFYALDKIFNEVPENIILENWEGKDDIVVKVKEGMEYLNKVTGGTNIAKLIYFLRKITPEKNAKNNKTLNE
jgi:uncharacterized membrane protein YkvA (DUF1232 family)